MTREVINELKKYTLGKKNTETVKINVLHLNRVIKALEQQPCEGMRDATEEERRSTKNYIDSISKPTGLQFDDIYEELDFVQPHKKISVKLNLQPCEDECITKAEVINTIHKTMYGFFDIADDDSEEPINDKDKLLLTINKAISNAVEALPSVTPQRPRGKWIDCCCSECRAYTSLNIYKLNFCPNCGAYMGGGENDE